jgi:hypothetical protein
VKVESFNKAVERVAGSDAPLVEFLRAIQVDGSAPGVLAASFNPPTNAHLDLVRIAAHRFSLDEKIMLAGATNAD